MTCPRLILPLNSKGDSTCRTCMASNYAFSRTTRKLVQYFSEVLEEERDKLNENLVVGNSKFYSLTCLMERVY
jgi:hypothetical protein